MKLNGRSFYSNRGFTTLELLVSSTLGILVTLIIASTIHLSTKLLKKVQGRYQADLAALSIKTHLEKIVADIDSHTLPIWPVIDEAGGITYLSLQSELEYVIEATSGNQHLACPRENLPLSDREVDILGIGVNGYRIFSGLASAPLSTTGCREFKLNPIEHPVIAGLKQTAELQVLIPVSATYKTMLGSNNQLRFQSFRGGRRVENQPLNIQLRSFKPELTLKFNERIARIDAELIFTDAQTRTVSVTNSLGRKPIYNLVLGRP